jgi:hypothetical protein
LPKEIHDDHFYGHENDFYTALEASVSKWSPTKNFIGEKFVKKYEWNNLINKYDHTFRLIPNK